MAALERAFLVTLGRPARFPRERWAEPLLRALRRLDRCANAAGGSPGEGMRVALAVIEQRDGLERAGAVELAWSLAALVPTLDAISKAWRRRNRPLVKAERERRQKEREARERASRPTTTGGA